MADLSSTMNQFHVIEIYTIFTEQQDTNSIQVPIDYKPGCFLIHFWEKFLKGGRYVFTWKLSKQGVCALKKAYGIIHRIYADYANSKAPLVNVLVQMPYLQRGFQQWAKHQAPIISSGDCQVVSFLQAAALRPDW